MKKLRVKSAAFLGAMLLLLSLPNVSSLGSLRSVSAPYAGFYDCKKLTLDGKDMLGHFATLRLEIKGEGEMLLSYQDKSGVKGEKTLSYEYLEEENALLICYRDGEKELKKRAQFSQGELTFSLQLNGRLLLAVFSTE
ncbi:MAG: hypothetical protein IJX81_03515 [Clostridia bacterium]|nr:hypothetical protein [Clostridia bacterium]